MTRPLHCPVAAEPANLRTMVPPHVPKPPAARRSSGAASVAWLACLLAVSPRGSAAEVDALGDYVHRPDPAFSWKLAEKRTVDGVEASRLSLVSQAWRGTNWTHDVLIVRPAQLRNPDIAFLLIGGDGDVKKQFDVLKMLADRAGALAAHLNRVPNQPLYGGRKEDALIAYSFGQYLQSGDRTWPLLFPMVKSAVRAMDATEASEAKETGHAIKRWVVSGASKRGWTTWLTGATDPRVCAIAPMVIDMLNMRVQTDWAAKMYGRQSEEIQDYVDNHIIEHEDDPRMVELRHWVDPYSYRTGYTVPKLLLLGTDDPYWVVDSLRHYWADLPEPKLVFQTPNAGHDLAGGVEAKPALAAFFQMVADHQAPPTMSWKFDYSTPKQLSISAKLDRPAKAFRLWTASSPVRDFRQAVWSSSDLPPAGAGTAATSEATGTVQGKDGAYRAALIEAELVSADGHPYKLSTEARVIPDGPPPAK